MMDDSGRTALSYACELCHNDMVKILVKNNVDPDIPDKSGECQRRKKNHKQKNLSK